MRIPADRYVNKDVVRAAGFSFDGADVSDDDIKGALLEVLPGILARHRRDLLLGMALDCMCLADHQLFRREAEQG